MCKICDLICYMHKNTSGILTACHIPVFDGIYWYILYFGIYRYPVFTITDRSYDMLSHMTGLGRHMLIQDFHIVQ
jgi:hypothetical protein